jgi:hypothetical protein
MAGTGEITTRGWQSEQGVVDVDCSTLRLLEVSRINQERRIRADKTGQDRWRLKRNRAGESAMTGD